MEVRRAANVMADGRGLVGLTLGIENDYIRAELFRQYAGLEAVFRNANLESVRVTEFCGQLKWRLGAENHYFATVPVKLIKRYLVGFHKSYEMVFRYSTVAAARNSVPAQLSAVEPLTDRTGSYVAYPCHLSRCQHLIVAQSSHLLYIRATLFLTI